MEGHEGWDDYAPFYDWENARTLGRRDVPFWRNLALQAGGPVLELGCGTGRISLPLGKAGVPLVGIDRSERMLARARTRTRRARLTHTIKLIRGDIRFTPFARPSFAMVMAPYGILQSLLRERDLAADAPGSASRSRARRHVRYRARGRPALVAGVQQASQLEGVADEARGRACHAGRDCEAGPCPALDHFQSGVHRAPGHEESYPPLCTDLSDLVGSSNGPSSREVRLRDYSAAR